MKILAFLFIVSLCLAGMGVAAEDDEKTLASAESKRSPDQERAAVTNVTVAAAIKSALSVHPGYVIEVDREVANGALVYQVVIVSANLSSGKVTVDANDGHIVAVEIEA